MKILICLSGIINKEILYREFEKADYIIAADGGGNALYKNKLNPNLLVGDLDSISNEALKFLEENNTEIEKYPPEKDYTDGELALLKAFTLNPSEIVFLGGIGSRIDHVFGNIELLYKASINNVKAKIIDKNNIIMLSNKSTRVKKHCGYKFSILPYSDCVKNLSIAGGKYPLNNYNLKRGETITISNEFEEEYVYITFEEGNILIIISKDDDF
ncbi:MAG: thiamine diphosphokinase [Clostridiaceae bacterium]